MPTRQRQVNTAIARGMARAKSTGHTEAELSSWYMRLELSVTEFGQVSSDVADELRVVSDEQLASLVACIVFTVQHVLLCNIAV